MTTTIAKRQNGNPSVNFGNVVDNFFQTGLRRFLDDNFRESELPLTTGNAPVNVRETQQQYEIDVIAPGCRKEDFTVNVQDNLLTVSFTHNEEKQGQKANWVRNEYMQRSFSRTFTLDDTVDVNKIQAAYTDGILRLTLPKNEKAKMLSRKIDIQ